MTTRRAASLLGLAALAAILAGGPSWAQPVGVPPLPKPKLETRPARPPAERLVWQPGHWEWDVMNARYVWHHGRHVVRRPGVTRFVAGRWVVTGGDWAWRRARWK
jgi:hypothetical protein